MRESPDFKHIIIRDQNRWAHSDPSLIELIRNECDFIRRSQDRFAKNYTFERLDLPRHHAFDLLLDPEGQIAGWCGLYNGGRYPDGVFRIMNRLYLHPRYRNTFFKPYTRQLYFDQVRRHRSVIRALFLSRNSLKGLYHVRRWVKYGAGEPGWEVSPGLVKVAPCEKKVCYQYIAFKKFSAVDWPPKALSEDEWALLPDGE